MRFVIAGLLLSASSALTEWTPKYANVSPRVREWYRNAQLTPEAQKRFHYVKCCDRADVFRTQFR
jgi:hypothetical protein